MTRGEQGGGRGGGVLEWVVSRVLDPSACFRSTAETQAVQLKSNMRFPSNEKGMLIMMAAPELLNHYHSLPGHFSVLHVHAHMQQPPEYIHERAASLPVL